MGVGALAFAAGIFCIAVLEPRFHINGWESLDDSKLVKAKQTLSFVDENGDSIENPVYDLNRYSVDITDIPRHTVDAFVSIEDRRFYAHHGVDYKRMVGALISNIKSHSFKEGASTITQQLVKNTHLNSDKTIERKVKEIRIAKELERKYTKDQIMAMYLNMLYFGDNVYGIETAAKVFFDIEPSELSISQSALLAAIINNPTKYNPYKNKQNAESRRNLVLTQMLKYGKITEKEYNEAIDEPVSVCEKRYYPGQYINSVIDDARNILGVTKDVFFLKKIVVETYCERNKEDCIREILNNCTDIPEGCNAHVVVLKNNNGTLIADVGLKSDNLAYLQRQPGSTIKPLLCYAPALDNGSIYNCTPIEDTPTAFGEYVPSNYRNKYRGWVSAEDALSYSLNVPAVKLLQSCGVDYCKSVCEKFGINFDENDDNLALALGGMSKGVTLRELADAYRVFAAGGKYVKGSSIKSITDSDGKTIYSDNRKESSAIGDDTAYLMNLMLSKCAGKGTASKLSRFSNVCAKTGTVGDSDGNTDLYCVAYSPNYTVGVWIGNTAEKMPNNITSSGHACDIAAKVFDLLGDADDWEKPQGIQCRYIDSEALENEHKVLLAGSDIPLKDKSAQWFSNRYIPKEYSNTGYGGGYFEYDDLLNLDFDNFEIIESLLD